MGCHCDHHHHGKKKRSVRGIVRKECDLSTLNDLVDSQPAISDALDTLDPITLFAPTNKSFKNFTPGATCGEVDQILLYHVVAEYLDSCTLENDKLYNTLREGEQVRSNVYGGRKFREVITINGVPVVEADLKARNGVVHKIEPGVLCPPAGNILELALATPDLSTLVAAVQAASPAIAEALANTDALTVFAPSNEAFAELDADLQKLGCSLGDLLDNQALLDSVLLYHVLGQTVWSAAIRTSKTKNIHTLLEGEKLDFKRKCEKKILVRDETCGFSRISTADILGSNGAVHIIDRVLLPIPLSQVVDQLSCSNP